MLAIGRALMAEPRLIIFDEISLGLAPIMVDRLYGTLREINGRGVAMVVIEQNVERGLALADHVAVLEKGRVALVGTPSQMRADDRLISLYVGEAKGNEPTQTPQTRIYADIDKSHGDTRDTTKVAKKCAFD
jgi:ABC-type branched-subunit amino acid transport system ATPase component